jgi:Fe-S-cluster containining protein
VGQNPIATIEDLKSAIAEVLQGISEWCAACTFCDCMGYLWVLPEEEDRLLRAGIDLMQFNGESGPLFVSNLQTSVDGRPYFDRHNTACPHRQSDGRCGVHAVRPLVCHLYPLGLEMRSDGTHWWALHLDCEFVARSSREHDFDRLVRELTDVISRLSPTLHDAISRVWISMEALWDVSEENRYLRLLPIVKPA